MVPNIIKTGVTKRSVDVWPLFWSPKDPLTKGDVALAPLGFLEVSSNGGNGGTQETGSIL